MSLSIVIYWSIAKLYDMRQKKADIIAGPFKDKCLTLLISVRYVLLVHQSQYGFYHHVER